MIKETDNTELEKNVRLIWKKTTGQKLEHS